MGSASLIVSISSSRQIVLLANGDAAPARVCPDAIIVVAGWNGEEPY